MHDLPLHLAHSLVAPLLSLAPLRTFWSAGGGGASDNSTVKVAIVTTLGVVVAAAITALASTFQRDRGSAGHNSDNFTRDYIRTLVRDQHELRKVQTHYSLLREACLERHLDPDDLIHEQEQRST